MGTIVTLGEILVEILAAERGQSFRRPGLLVGPFPSGAPAIFVDQVARLGHPARIIGCVGDDDFGRLNLERLQRDGVDTSGIRVRDDAVTGSAFVTYDQQGGRRFIFNITNSASAHLSAADVSEEGLVGCTHLHVMGSSLFSPGLREATSKAMDIVTGQGGRVSFDPNVRPELVEIPGMREALTSVLGRTHVFLPSGSELTLLTRAKTEEGAVEELLGLGIREIVVKRGGEGCVYHDGTRRLPVPALRVKEVDPTGAGDCFAATYVTCRHRGYPVEESLRYACAAGARAVTSTGPMEGTGGFAELETLLERDGSAGRSGHA
jgi:sugar/nucleoside kinase (ribokinase family)